MLYIRAEKLSRQPYRYSGHRPFPANHVFLYMSELKTYLKLFISYLEIERGMSWHTLDAYRRDCGRFLAGIGEDLPTEQDVFDFLIAERQRGRGDSSIQRSLAAVRSFLKFLLREEILEENPARHIETPRKGKYLPDVLGEDEVTRLMDAVVEHPSRYSLRDRAMIELLYASGLRVSEACGLRLQDVRSDQGIIHCKGKGNRERIVPTSKTCLDAIESYRLKERPGLLREDDEELLFLSRSGQRLGREVIAAMVRKYALLAGISKKVTPHTLRHSLATHLLRGRADLRIVQEILGHVNVETTELYTHIEKSELKELHAEFHPRG